nr:Tomm22 protein [Danio rerio]
MATIQELSPDSGRVETRPPEDEIEGDDEDQELHKTRCCGWPKSRSHSA